MFATCIIGDSIEDVDIRASLAQVTLAEDADLETVYMTLLACYILEEVYADYEDEWQLIVRKAKKWLEAAGIPKPSTLITKFKLRLLL